MVHRSPSAPFRSATASQFRPSAGPKRYLAIPQPKKRRWRQSPIIEFSCDLRPSFRTRSPVPAQFCVCRNDWLFKVYVDIGGARRAPENSISALILKHKGHSRALHWLPSCLLITMTTRQVVGLPLPPFLPFYVSGISWSRRATFKPPS